MAVKTFTTGEVLTAADTNTYLNNGGLVYVKSQAIGSAVSSVNVTNAFSSTYDAYKIVVAGGAGSGTEVLRIKLGASTTGYYQGLNYIQTNATTTPKASGTDNTTAYFDSCGIADTNGISANVDLINPGLPKYTILHNPYAFISGGDAFVGMNVGIHGVATAYTEFTLTCAAGTMTGGTITVYGYRLG